METGRLRASPWAALAALCVGFFLIMMETTIVPVGLPSITTSLGTDLSSATWVNSVYLLTYAVPLLLCGRLGDRYGRRRLVVLGLVVFAAASLACALATDVSVLIAARAVQGLGGAMMAPQSLAFISRLFPAERRGTAIGVWAAVAGTATTVGPLLGGLLVGTLGWRWIFAVNVPIAIAGVVAVLLLLPGGGGRAEARFDLLGTVLSGAALFALVFGVQNGEQFGWGRVAGPVTVPHVLVAGAVLLVAFVLVQRRRPDRALLPLRLFGDRNFSAANLAVATFGFAVTAIYIPLTVLLQSVLGISALRAGLVLAPFAVVSGVTGPIAGRLCDRYGSKPVVLTGFVTFALGVAAVAYLAGPDTSPTTLAAVLLLCGLGGGLSFTPMATVATAGLPAELVGAGSGVYNTSRQVGSVLGSAAVSMALQAQALGASRGAAEAASVSVPPGERPGFVDAVVRAAQALGEGAPAGPAAHGALSAGLGSAVGVSLVVPLGLLAVGFVACLTIRSGRPHHTPAEGPAPLGDRTGSDQEREDALAGGR